MVRRYHKELCLVFCFIDRATEYEDRQLGTGVFTIASEILLCVITDLLPTHCLSTDLRAYFISSIRATCHKYYSPITLITQTLDDKE
jgi:hypothetical protein